MKRRQIKSTLEQGTGKVKEMVGRALGNRQMEAEGKNAQTTRTGRVRRQVGDIGDYLHETANDLGACIGDGMRWASKTIHRTKANKTQEKSSIIDD